MGTLSLGSPEVPPEAAAAAPATAANLDISDPGPMKGKKLETGLSIVLSNAAGHFTRPCILDCKLGARLWDDHAPEPKRARLDKVAAQTTSGSLGFRVAGMRVYRGEDSVNSNSHKDQEFATFDAEGYQGYNKLYGRQFSEKDVAKAFRTYLPCADTAVGQKRAHALAKRFEKDVADIEKVLASQESRMVSASLLFVYEGDTETFDAVLAAEKAVKGFGKRWGSVSVDGAVDASVEGKMDGKGRGHGRGDMTPVEFIPPARSFTNAELGDIGEDEGVDEDEEEDEEEEPELYTVKIIDFAHAKWTPSEGPDENALQGVRSLKKIFGELKDEFTGGI
ncbi:SAICAR synthase-like protein [Aulographum hederae CBS 113979]|uniref:Kinase n=1 Tax=Aulographum hederae CBS 113979 TaxID=1176131 RepID=A0A6G1GWF4_9PEZI|nr:SAICAR synthase-like protein [Aulographum hederae CBS 113979]